MSVSVTYNLMGAGWSECIVDIDGHQAHISASYLSDAFGELLRAVANLLQGAGEDTVSFDEEPGEYRWRLVRVGSELVRVQIFSFKSLWGNEPDEAGEPVLDVVCPLASFAEAVATAAQRVLDEHGMDGYRDKWVEHGFPADRLAEIQQLLNT